MIGKQTPPRDDPETTIPIAKPRFLRNQVFVHNIAVWKLQLEMKGNDSTLRIDQGPLPHSERGRIDSIHGKGRSSSNQKLWQLFRQ